jgi:hypothetical protein
VSPLLADSVHCEIHLFGLIEKALQSSERSLLLLAEGGPSSHGAVALSRSEAIGRTEALRLALGPLRRDHHLLFYFSFAASASLVPLGCPASGAVGVGQWFVDYSALIHKLCKSTASFLATATTARFFEFLAPREAIFSP